MLMNGKIPVCRYDFQRAISARGSESHAALAKSAGNACEVVGPYSDPAMLTDKMKVRALLANVGRGRGR